jgi:dihydroorotate dehydrogenase
MGVRLAMADGATGFLRLLDAETAHGMTISLLKSGLAPKTNLPPNTMLKTQLAGMDFANPVGLAAGFDKNAEVVDACLGLGFGFVEIGAVTPQPQSGNQRPRVFRLAHNRAIINRYGFNNDGLDIIAARLKARVNRPGIVGANLGANKDSSDKAGDYVTGYRALSPYVKFCTLNVSSPNTPGLRQLQKNDELDKILRRLGEVRAEVQSQNEKLCPLFLKIAPDLRDEEKTDIAALVIAHKIDALIVSNTTLARPSNLEARYRAEAGGLSGAPLFRPSTTLLKEFALELKGQVPLIGVGGVSSAREAYVKILHGASLVQLYTAMVYEGPGLVKRIITELPNFLRADGFTNIKQAVAQAL